MTHFSRLVYFWLLLSVPLLVIANPFVDVETNRGTFTLQLTPTESPKTVANFLSYVDANFYDNTLFHRVINGFMIQGGGFTAEFVKKPTLAPIVLESNNGLLNKRGTVAMARTSEPNSATAQFFINSVDNSFLDFSATNPGYAVFGAVVAGLDVIDSISAVKTSDKNTSLGTLQNVPIEPIIINAIRRREGQLTFKGLAATYTAGDVINISVEESGIIREKPLDLWVAILLPNGQFVYLTEGSNTFSSTPTVFKSAVSTNITSHPVLNFTVPAGLAGHYTFFAIFNQANKNIADLLHSLRSNIARAETDLSP